MNVQSTQINEQLKQLKNAIYKEMDEKRKEKEKGKENKS